MRYGIAMPGKFDDLEVGLAENVLFWLAKANADAQISIYKALYEMLETRSQTKSRSADALKIGVFVLGDQQESSYDFALWDEGRSIVYVVDIRVSGQINRIALESQLERISAAQARPPNFTSFMFQKVPSPSDFAGLIDALGELLSPSELTMETSLPFASWSDVETLHTITGAIDNLRYSVDPINMSSFNDFIQNNSFNNSDISYRNYRLKFWPTVSGRQTLSQTYRIEMPKFVEEPSAADDAEFFFSRTSPVDLPSLSSGRKSAASLVG